MLSFRAAWMAGWRVRIEGLAGGQILPQAPTIANIVRLRAARSRGATAGPRRSWSLECGEQRRRAKIAKIEERGQYETLG
jgi:hypothetical protein